jgi:predicted metal-dependent phosphoesterase TrpH
VGEEVRTLEGEIIGLFISRSIPRGLRPELVCDLVHDMGGLTYFPHPFDRFRANFAPHRLADLADRVDIIEVYNPWARPQDNEAAARICSELGKVAATGSDAHGAEELGRSWMEIEEYDDPAGFLERLALARHVVTAESGTGRRA